MIRHIFLFLIIYLFSSATFAGDVSVRGYYRSNGTYVKPHYRSAPDGNFSNNWTTAGNINPYTGKLGTRVAPDTNYKIWRQSTATTATVVNKPRQVKAPERRIQTVALPKLHEVKREVPPTVKAPVISAIALQTPTVVKISQHIGNITKPPATSRRHSPLTREAQEYLNYLGFDVGVADGVLGSHTRAAVYAYQRTRSLAITGTIDEPLLETMSQEIGAQSIQATYQNMPAAIEVESNDKPSEDLTGRTQLYLTMLGFYNGSDTGVDETKLEHAIMRFQNSNRVSVDGQVTLQLLSSIRSKLYN